MGKKSAAVDLINARLLERPNDPRLWCSLGDVTISDSCYEKALEVSNDKSVRAKRALARSAYNRGDFEKSKILWEAAMALNSLYSDGWFALGAAALKVFYFIFSYSLVAIYFHSKSNLINNWNSCHAG
jgi:tetratricopeptide (TPR) repeat protein